MTLRELLEKLPDSEAHGDMLVSISFLTCDSRSVLPGTLFFALRGAQTDGHSYIEQAFAAGAAAVVLAQVDRRLIAGVLLGVEHERAHAARDDAALLEHAQRAGVRARAVVAGFASADVARSMFASSVSGLSSKRSKAASSSSAS